ERVFRRGGGEADDEPVEIVQYLTPEAVDAPVALVHEHDVEELRRDLLVVGHVDRALEALPGRVELRALLNRWVEVGLSPDHGVEALDGRDDHLRRVSDGIRGEALDVV